MKKISEYIHYFRIVFQWLGANRKRYFLGLLLASVELIIISIAPKINSLLVNSVVEGKGQDLVFQLAGLSMFLLMCTPVVVYGKYVLGLAIADSTSTLRKKIFRYVLHLPHQEMDKKGLSNIINTLSDDAGRAMGMLGIYVVNNLASFVFIFFVSFFCLASTDVYIAALSLVYSMFSLSAAMYFNPLTKKLEQEAKEAIDGSNKYYFEALSGISVIRVFSLYSVMSARFHDICESIKTKRIRFRTVNGLAYGIVDLFTQAAQAIGFILCILLRRERWDIGTVVYCATLFGLMADAVLRLSSFMLMMPPYLVAIDRIEKLMDYHKNTLSGCLYNNHDDTNVIEIKNVSFSYTKSQKVLGNINFAVNQGEYVAVVGKSGCGKSTLLQLMSGFCIPDQGQVCIQGLDTAEMEVSDLTQWVSYVPQDATLFEGSIRDNIQLGRLDASEEEIEQVGVNLSSEFGFQSNILDLHVGEEGAGLSKGQKQQVIFERAKLRRTPIYLFDEICSAMDVQAEKKVNSWMQNRPAGTTVVAVTHRLADIKNADRVVVMSEGQIVEEGSFDDLLQQGDTFRRLLTDKDITSESAI